MGERRRPRLSKPGEHGGLVTLGGSVTLAAAAAPEPLVAAAAALVYALAYLARGPIERKARRFRPRAWDASGLVAYALVALAALALVATARPVLALIVAASALAIPAVGAVVTRARVHRSFVVELGGMAVCGASAGLALLAGGASPTIAAAAGVALAGYAAAAVPMVRAEVRELPPGKRLTLTRAGLGLLAITAATTALLVPAAATAFVPRLAHSAWHAARGPSSPRIAMIALREAISLAVLVALLILALTGVLGSIG